jgi:hypothetical protein
LWMSYTTAAYLIYIYEVNILITYGTCFFEHPALKALFWVTLLFKTEDFFFI